MTQSSGRRYMNTLTQEESRQPNTFLSVQPRRTCTRVRRIRPVMRRSGAEQRPASPSISHPTMVWWTSPRKAFLG
eukprot:2444577-Lingulodinium_polyedra.AAC.1